MVFVSLRSKTRYHVATVVPMPRLLGPRSRQETAGTCATNAKWKTSEKEADAAAAADAKTCEEAPKAPAESTEEPLETTEAADSPIETSPPRDETKKSIGDTAEEAKPNGNDDANPDPVVPEESSIEENDFSSTASPVPANPPENSVDKQGDKSFSPEQASAKQPALAVTQDDNAMEVDGEDDGDDDDEGQYDLKKVLTLEELQQEDTICCSQDGCGLPAFGLYVNNANPRDRWFYCLDCQEADFEGWPPIEELPVKYMSPEHVRVMASKCSTLKNPGMPAFPESLSPKGKSATSAATSSANSNPNFVTPPPNDLVQSKSIGPAKATGKQKALEVHKKWLEAAQSMGGVGARIVVSKPHAKKLIFDYLYDEFKPMNITQIYKGLKAVVPQPVLNACLQEMVPDQFGGKNPFGDDSDDEDGGEKASKKNKESTEPYSGSLIFKAGKNLSTNLYFVDHTKIKEMDYDELNTLVNNLANAKAEMQGMEATIKSHAEAARKLLAEPTNEELTLQLDSQEKLITEDLEVQVAEKRKLKVNEKHRERTKKNIEYQAAQWRQRRRACLEFLTNLEEMTDGTISRAKCLKGDGQIVVDSDEAVAKAALQADKDRRQRSKIRGGLKGKPLGKGLVKSGGSGGPSSGLLSTLLAVTLDPQLNIVRVYAKED